MSIDIKEITSAWWDSYFANEAQKQLAKNRLDICKECPSLQQKFKKYKKITITVCNECGCPISKKIFSHKFNACPLNKWKDVDEKNIDSLSLKKKNVI